MDKKNWFETFFYSKYGTGLFSLLMPYWIYGEIKAGYTHMLGVGGHGIKVTAEGSPTAYWLSIAVLVVVWLVCIFKFINYMKKQ